MKKILQYFLLKLSSAEVQSSLIMKVPKHYICITAAHSLLIFLLCIYQISFY